MGLSSYIRSAAPLIAMITVESTDVGISVISTDSMVLNNVRDHIFGRVAFIMIANITDAIAKLRADGVSYWSQIQLTYFSSALANLIPIFTFLLSYSAVTGAFVATLYKGPPLLINSSSPSNFLQQALFSQQTRWIIGGFLILLVCLWSAAWNVLQTATVKEYPDNMAIVFFFTFFITIQSLVFSVVLERNPSAWTLKFTEEVAAILCTAIFGSLFRTAIHTWCLQKKGPVNVAMFKPLGIPVSSLLTVTFLADSIFLGRVIGLVIILVGFYTVIWRQAKEKMMVLENEASRPESSHHKAPLLHDGINTLGTRPSSRRSFQKTTRRCFSLAATPAAHMSFQRYKAITPSVKKKELRETETESKDTKTESNNPQPAVNQNRNEKKGKKLTEEATGPLQTSPKPSKIEGYNCFTLNKEDLVPTIEEYTTLLHIEGALENRIYSKSIKTQPFRVKLAKIAGVREEWVTSRTKQKGESEGIAWTNIKELIQSHPDTKVRFDLFALGMYGMVIFPKVLGYVEAAVVDLFEQLPKKINPASAILAETFRSVNACRKLGGGRFSGCTQLLYVWVRSHFWRTEKVSYRRFNTDYSPLKEFLEQEWPKEIKKDMWINAFRNLQNNDIVWRAPWQIQREFFYKCGDYNWIMLLGLWGGIGYAPLLVMRQYEGRQFVPVTAGLHSSEFAFHIKNYKRNIMEAVTAWKTTFCIRAKAAKEMLTPDYEEWRSVRKNENIPLPDQNEDISMEDRIKVVPSEIEILRAEFEVEREGWSRELEQMRRDKAMLGVDIDFHSSQCAMLRENKEKVDGEFRALKKNYQELYKSRKASGPSQSTVQMTRELNIEKRRVEDLKGKNSRLLKSLEKGKQKMEDFEGFESEMNQLIAELETRGQKIEKFNIEKEKWELKRKNFNTKLEVEQEVARNWMQRCRNKNVQIHKLNQRTQEARTKLEEDLDQSRNKNAEFNAYILQLEESLFQEKVRLGPIDLKEKVKKEVIWCSRFMIQMSEVARYVGELAVEAKIIEHHVDPVSKFGKKVSWLMKEIIELNRKATPYL
ncbi:DNA-repair protein UVH3, putative isoform 1 [Hibiscus syriacus]|uniref:DNA-repair protein UVH3, putative isoform 1 n=1 Tax=Hibiscus syriacus TaxID=106335 RepID=A0A6A2ZK53_HIBSY|nr:DNA-repair protein UVH3, putative isoform 1 [Hibiscus syriacus]